jgi:hypothetical protein
MLLDIILDTILEHNISLIYVIISPFFYWKREISVVRYSVFN